LHDLSEDDFALRSASSLSLNLMINMCLQMFGSEQTPDLVTSILYQAIVRAVAGRNNDRARKEYLSLLSNLGKAFPSATLLRDVCLLQHADVDLDFFANFCHIQLHRRRRALQRAAQLADQLGPSSVEKVLIPLCMHIVYETTSAVNSASASSSIGGGTASKTASTVAASEGALVDEAVRTIGALSGCLGWTAYYRLVSSVLKPIRTHPQHLKVLVRVLCAIVDRFHFEVAEPSGSAPFEREKKPMNRGNVAVTDAFDPANSTVHRQTNIRDRIQARLAAREAEVLASFSRLFHFFQLF
jgi:U3 small nucleolar RNA-associated protein 20